MTFRHKYAPGLENFWVVTVISNPVRYSSRYRLFQEFKARVLRAGANLMTVELALGDRPHEVSEPHRSALPPPSELIFPETPSLAEIRETRPGPKEIHIQLRGWDELWHKENLINLGVARLPENWEYVAWIDGDIEFVRPDWPEETVHELQVYKVVQMFQSAMNLGPDGEMIGQSESFAESWLQGRPLQRTAVAKKYYAHLWHSGYAWAARREAWEGLGGLMDFAILGAADHHMAWALFDDVLNNIPKAMPEPYKKHALEWQLRAAHHVRKDVGVVKGTILHHWHGKIRDRRYNSRWKILVEHAYDPDRDIKRNAQGVLVFTRAGERMRNDIRAYFRARNEDSIDR